MLKQLDVLIGFVVVMSVVSLLITIITQMISATLGLRGRNLADALKAMVRKIDPKIDGQVKDLTSQLADKVLTLPAISGSMLSMSRQWPVAWKRASAIRPDELLEVMKGIAGTTPSPAGSPKNLEEAAARLLQTLNIPTAATTDAINAIKAGLPAMAVKKGAALVHELNAATDVALGNLDKWFNSVQDRAQQWFTMQTRFWTVIASVVMAFLLQLDAFRLVGQISSDPELRSKLVASSKAIEKQAEDILQDAVSPESVGQEAVKRLRSKTAETAKQLPAGVDTAAKANEWLQAHPNDDAKTIDAVRQYWELTQTVSQEKLDRGTKQFAALTDVLSKSNFQLVPDPYRWENCWPVHLHFWGILASAALLSLGAPFWFNLLKSLSNLRPVLASAVDKDPKQFPKTASGGGA